MPEVHQSRLISKKPFILLFFAMSLLIVLGGRIYYRNKVRTILAEKHDALKTISDLKTDQIVNWLRERKSDALSVATSPFFSQAVNTWIINGESDHDLQKKIMARLQIVQGQHRYADILIATPQGKLLLALEPQRRRLDPITAKQIAIACKTGTVHFTDFYYCPLHKRVHLDFIAPIANPGNKPLAVLILRNAPEEFLYPLIQKWPTPSKTAETLIVRQEGDSVLFLNNLRYNPTAALRMHISTADTNTPAVRAVLGQAGIFEGKDYRGIRVLSHIGTVPETNWFLIAKIDRQEIYSDLNTELRFVSVLIVILLVMVAAGMALIYNHRQRGVYHALYIEEKSRFAVQEEFRTTLYSIGDAVITTDRLGRIKYLNPVAEKLTGWQEKEAEGRDLPEVFNIVNEETRQIVQNPVQRVLDAGLIIGLANHTVLISKNNQEIPIADSGAPIKNEDGEIIGVILVFRDQTAERVSQNTIRNSEKELRTIWESSRDGMRLCNAEGIMIRVNPAFCHMVGKPESELIGKPLSVIYDNYAADHILAKDIERFQTDMIEPHFERLVTLHDGRSVWFELSNSTVEINDEKLQLNIFRNITERKLAEKDLRESEERFHSILDGMMEGAQIIGFDWRYLYMNSTAEKQFHRSKMDLLGKKFASVWPGIDQTTLFVIIKHCMEERTPVHIENEFDFPGGSIGLFEFSIQPIPQGIFILSVDIAERRQVEEQIRYQADLLKNVSDAIIATDIDKQITMWNPAAEAMYGWKAEDVLGKKFRDIVNPEYIYDSRKTVFEKINKEGAWSGEIVHLSKSGRSLSVLSTISEIKNNSGDNIGMVSINHDISEQKKMEAQFRSVWEKSQDGMRLTDENGTVIQVNDAFCRMMGIERSEIEGQSLAVIYVEEQWEHVEKMHRERFSAHTVKPHSEQKVSLRDGRKIWVEVTNSFFETGNHKPLLLGIFRDITNRKETEDALKLNEENYRRLVENSHDIIYTLNPDGVFTYVSPVWTMLLGHSVNEVVGKSFQIFVHPDDIPACMAFLQTVIKTKQRQDGVEYRVRHADGTWRWHLTSAVPFLDESSAIIKFYGLAKDITKRKRVEDALQMSEERYKTFFKTSRDCVFITTIDGKWIDMNDVAVEFFGYPNREELMQVKIEDLYANPEERKRHINVIIKKSYTTDFPVDLRKKDGTIINTLITSAIQYDTEGKITGLMGTIKDITERKQAEVLLRDSEEKFRNAFMLSPDSININRLKDGMYVAINHGFTHAMGYTEDEIIGKTSIEMNIWEDPDDRKKMVSGLKKNGFIENLEARFRTKKGDIRYGLMSASIIDINGVQHILNITRDVTERKRLENVLQENELRYRTL
ncbi:MAG: PAS domain S-box protein, partial [Candidatus Marinimicrobia bacterium]|nr:PAS domain S-box protein [Candidatus Neomarinimicrobiota bacterium]